MERPSICQNDVSPDFMTSALKWTLCSRLIASGLVFIGAILLETPSASAAQPITFAALGKAQVCLSRSAIIKSSPQVCFKGGGALVLAALPSPARTSQVVLDGCLAGLGVDLVGDSLEGGPFDEFFGLGELFAIAELGKQAADSNLCWT